MAITLGGINLPDVIWENEFDWSEAADSVEMTLGGKPVVWVGQRMAGRPIDLVANEDSGMAPTAECPDGFCRSLVAQLKAKEKTAGFTGILNYEGQALKVRFRTEEPPAVDVRPIIPRPNHEGGDLYSGRIKLITV